MILCSGGQFWLTEIDSASHSLWHRLLTHSVCDTDSTHRVKNSKKWSNSNLSWIGFPKRFLHMSISEGKVSKCLILYLKITKKWSWLSPFGTYIKHTFSCSLESLQWRLSSRERPIRAYSLRQAKVMTAPCVGLILNMGPCVGLCWPNRGREHSFNRGQPPT